MSAPLTRNFGTALHRVAVLSALAVAVLAGLAVMAPGAANAQSRFQGHWNGSWNDPATRTQGTIDFGVAFDGDVRARIDNPERGFSGELTGRLDESGHIDGVYSFVDGVGSGRSHSYRAAGSVQPTGPDGTLYGGVALFDGPTRVGGLVITLTYVAGPYYRDGRR